MRKVKLVMMAVILPACSVFAESELTTGDLIVTNNATIYRTLNFATGPAATIGDTYSVEFKLWAAGGGGTHGNKGNDGLGGGSGGFVSGTILNLADGTVLKVVVGQGGTAGTGGKAGGGGGYCGVFLNSVAIENALLIAGAGSSGIRAWGGTTNEAGQGGGGLIGRTSPNSNAGGGGTQSAGGAGGAGTHSAGEAGSALQGGRGGEYVGSGGSAYGGGPDGGGNNYHGTPGSGGAGYYGGGGGGNDYSGTYGGPGGGGSSYIIGTAINVTSLAGSNGLGGAIGGYLGGGAVNASDEHYVAGVGKGGNGAPAAGGITPGGNGLCVYSINGGAWVTLYCITNDQTIIIGQSSSITTLSISSNGINQVNASGSNIFMGKVGIGTESPAEKLHVAGNMQVEGSLTLGSSSRTNWPSGADGALMILNNLSEITGEANKAAARDNLGLGAVATNNAGAFLTPTSDGSQLINITAEQVGALSINAGALLKANNLSELTDTAATARDNLGLGTAAMNNTGDFLAPTGDGSQLSGITASQVGALSTTGGVVNGSLDIQSIPPKGDLIMGSYTNQ